RRHTKISRDWSSDVCSSDLIANTDKPEEVVDEQIASQGTSSDEAKDVPDTTYVRTYQEMDRDLTLVEAEVGGVVRLNNIFFETEIGRASCRERVKRTV